MLRCHPQQLFVTYLSELHIISSFLYSFDMNEHTKNELLYETLSFDISLFGPEMEL